MLLERILYAFDDKQVELGQSEVSQYGGCDDFIYSEYLTDNFDDMHQIERFAAMKVIHAVIDTVAKCYPKLVDEGELQYEDFSQVMVHTDLDEIINVLQPEEEY